MSISDSHNNSEREKVLELLTLLYLWRNWGTVDLLGSQRTELDSSRGWNWTSNPDSLPSDGTSTLMAFTHNARDHMNHLP